MKIVLIHGQNHKGSTYMIAHEHFPPMEPDYSYWEERGWHRRKRPWKQD